MNKRNLLRRLKFLSYNLPYIDLSETNIDLCKKVVSDTTFKYPKNYIDRCVKTLELSDLVKKLGLSKEEFDKIVILVNKTKVLKQSNYKLKPQKEGRDNKGVYVGNGGSNANKIRYPKKNRSIRTWRIFYQMFPKKAEQDGWDGNTSKRMK